MKCLAFDTSGDSIHLGLRDGERTLTHCLPGGALASAGLIGACLALLQEAGLALSDLDAIAFGSGPGSFTGLRTACAVAQGFALGAEKPVIAVPTLLAVAMDAHLRLGHHQVLAAMDARMGEVYAASARIEGGVARFARAARAVKPDALQLAAGEVLVGNAHRAYPSLLRPELAGLALDAAPSAEALLACAAQLWAQGAAVDAALAQPEYVRNQVALTEAERAAAKAALRDASEVAA